jgi:hypothetical protein
LSLISDILTTTFEGVMANTFSIVTILLERDIGSLMDKTFFQIYIFILFFGWTKFSKNA